jgi:hypothetical protein
VSGISHHHLTQQGWVESEQRPEGTLETWTRTAERLNGRLSIDYTRNYEDAAVPAAERKDLRDAFGMPEHSVSGRDADIQWETVD